MKALLPSLLACLLSSSNPYGAERYHIAERCQRQIENQQEQGATPGSDNRNQRTIRGFATARTARYARLAAEADSATTNATGRARPAGAAGPASCERGERQSVRCRSQGGRGADGK